MFLADPSELVAAPAAWAQACTHNECTLHQLSPYIGKVKSVIAQDLLQDYTKPGDLVADPFCGSGTIPLEALLLGRRTFAADISPYAAVLTRAKLSAPSTLENARRRLQRAVDQLPASMPLGNSAPAWVRAFFNVRTLREVRQFADILGREKDHFLLACLLGILHHQRPGFLSYPSSHLVPYLRDKIFPRSRFPGLYGYRDLRPRMLAKLNRVYKKPAEIDRSLYREFVQSDIEQVELPDRCDCVATSPPYMNALDYGRDNRLRLWLLGASNLKALDRNDSVSSRAFYERSMRVFLDKAWRSLTPRGHLILVVGETTRRSGDGHPFMVIDSMIRSNFPKFRRRKMIQDAIPDIRRARRECRAVKREIIAVYRKAG